MFSIFQYEHYLSNMFYFNLIKPEESRTKPHSVQNNFRVARGGNKEAAILRARNCGMSTIEISVYKGSSRRCSDM